jgi:methyl-accepting chemotaxis protein
MKLRSLLLLTYSIIIVSVLVLVSIILLMVRNQNQLNDAQDVRYQSYLRADELRQSSDDLTRLARTYVMSGGDEKYEKMYWDILAIRNGEKPRPESYERIYWDLVSEYGDNPRPDSSETIALLDIMKGLGFTDEEFNFLEESNAASNGLVTTETIAMNAMKGLYDDGNGNYTVKGDVDQEMAARIMHDNTYHSDKAGIVTPIDQFFKQLEERTFKTVDALKNQGNLLLLISVIIVAFISILTIIIAIFITQRISNQLGEDPAALEKITEQVADGDLQIAFANKKLLGVYKSTKNMVTSLQYKADIIAEIASGDITTDVQIASKKDMLGQSLIRMTNSLNNLLGNVNMSVDQVNIGADQVAQASQSLSQGATEQASSLEEVSASITQINSQSRQNAENATEANGLAKQATEDAEKGNKEMEGLSVAMEKINNSSDQIKKIVKVIDDIAFQTNLLALNANVEAARAGKYGKGFAVVADEVRNLAVRSAEAVKETTEMVDESIKNIESGNKAVAATATQLESIVGGSSRVADFLEEIATASKEQAEAIDQITQGLEQIDQVTQSNTASAEESAAAAEELASQSIQLKNMVATFKLKNVQNSPVPQSRQLDYQPAPVRVAPGIEQKRDHYRETGIRPVDPASVIALDDDDFDRF